MKLIEEYIKKITNHIDPEYDWLDECLLNQLNNTYEINNEIYSKQSSRSH